MRYIILLLVTLLAASATQAQTFSNPASIAIPAAGTTFGNASPYPSNITVSGFSGTVTKATVTLTNVNHSFPGDIDILLVGPTGAKMILMSDTGDSSAISNVNLTFADQAADSLPIAAQIVSGTYKPTNYSPVDTFFAPAPAGPYDSTLSIFNGTDPNGTWSLYVFDDMNGDVGSIAGGWSLTLQSTRTAATVSVSGHVTTSLGRGVTGVNLSLTDSEGNARTAVSTAGGYYEFTDVQVGETYILSATGKRFTFSQPVQVLNVNDETTEVNIVADSEKKLRVF